MNHSTSSPAPAIRITRRWLAKDITEFDQALHKLRAQGLISWSDHQELLKHFAMQKAQAPNRKPSLADGLA